VFLFSPVAAVRFVALLIMGLTAFTILYAVIIPTAIDVTRPVPVVYANRRSPFHVTFRVHNKSILPIPVVEIQDAPPGFRIRRSATFVVSLPPFGSVECKYEASSDSRGEFFLDSTFAYGRDILHTFGWRRRFTSSMRVVVYPAVYPLDLLYETGLPSGPLKVSSKLYEDVTRFRSVREYSPGDELKRVNWKISARFGKLYSMEYVPSVYFPALIVLNLSENAYPVSGRATMVERAVETAASLLSYFVNIGQEVGLVTTGRIEGEKGHPSSPSHAGHGHAMGLLETLARVALSPENTDVVEHVRSSGVRIATGAKIIVVSPALKESQKRALLGLRRGGHEVGAWVIAGRSTHRDELQIEGVPTRVVGGAGKDADYG